jgi:uncharacterized protein (TIGR00369 family)
MTEADNAIVDRIGQSFERQSIMRMLGATLGRVEAGEVEIALPFRTELAQQHGYVHAGVIATIADSACGYACLTLMPPETEVLSIEFKINMLAPATGDLVARAKALRSGKTISVARADVFSLQDGKEKLVAAMQGTMMRADR